MEEQELSAEVVALADLGEVEEVEGKEEGAEGVRSDLEVDGGVRCLNLRL